MAPSALRRLCAVRSYAPWSLISQAYPLPPVPTIALTGEAVRTRTAPNDGEAKRVEAVLTRIGIDYAVEIAPYATRWLGLFPTRSKGARFSVVAGQARFCRQALQAAGITKGLVEGE